MQIKKAISVILLLALLVSCCACGAEQSAPSGASAGLSGKGRYMEEKISLPLPEGEAKQYMIGMCANDSGVEYFVVCSSGDEENFSSSYYRHTVASDGSVSTKAEPWIREYAPEGGNMLGITRGADGALYFTFSDYDESGKTQNHIIISRDDGGSSAELTGNGLSAFGPLSRIAPLDGGRIAVQDVEGGMLLLDAEGNILEELEAGNYSSNIAAHGSKLAVLAPSGKAVRIYDAETGSELVWEIDLPENSSVTLQYAQNGTLYLAAPTGLYSHFADGTIWENFVDGDVTNLGIPDYYISRMMVAGGEHDVIYVSDFDANVYRYAYDAEAAQTADVELNVFSLKENDTVRQAVVTFNRRRSDVKVNYTVATRLSGGGTDADYIKALNTELLAGTGPDVIILDGLPVDSYVEKGVLMDIAPTLDSAEAILPNVRAAYEKDGKLYAVPLGMGVSVVLTKDDAGCFASLGALAGEAGAEGGANVLSPIGYSYETLAKMLLENYSSELYEGGEAIGAFLADAKRVSDGIGSTYALGEGMTMLEGWPEDEVREMLLEDTYYPQLYSYVLGPARNVVLTMDALFDSNGMTSAAAAEECGGKLSGMGGRFYAVGLAGINKASKNVDTAEDFLRTLLSLDVQSAGLYGGSCFPVNVAALDGVFAQENDNFSTSLNLDENTSITGGWPSVAMRAQIRAIIDEANTPLSTNAELNAMLLPDIIAYLDGSATLDAATEKVSSVLSTYLSE